MYALQPTNYTIVPITIMRFDPTAVNGCNQAQYTTMVRYWPLIGPSVELLYANLHRRGRARFLSLSTRQSHSPIFNFLYWTALPYSGLISLPGKLDTAASYLESQQPEVLTILLRI